MQIRKIRRMQAAEDEDGEDSDEEREESFVQGTQASSKSQSVGPPSQSRGTGRYGSEEL